MSGILLPEIVIYNTLESIIKLLRKDIEENPSSDKNTLLYKILGVDEEGKDIKMNITNYYIQSKKMLMKPENMSVYFGYNQKTAQGVSLHILLPSEQGKVGIGLDEGYIEDEIFKDENKTSTQKYFTQSYDTVYQIMITGTNSLEVNLTYNIFKSMILMLAQHLELMGIRNMSLSGNDIIMQDDLAPTFYHKVINLSFFYEHNIPQLVVSEVAKKFYVIMKMVEFDKSTSKD